MNIISLRASNLKRLVAVTIEPSGAMVRLTGANGSGKSSTLDAIYYALTGVANIPSNPIRDGSDAAEVSLTLGEAGVVKLKVTRKFSRGKTSQLIVESPEGARFQSPQAMLDKLFGALTFDPEVFSRMSPKLQLEQLKSLVALDVDVDQLQRENDGDYTRRTEANARAKSLKANVDLYASGLNLDMEVEPIHVEALLREIDAAAKVNGDIRARMDEYNRYAAAIDSNKAEAARLRIEAQKMMARAEEVEAANQGLLRLRNATAVNPDGPPDALFGKEVDVADLTRKVQDATRENSARELQRQQREKHQIAVDAWTRAVEESDALTARMEARTQQRRDAIAGAKMPVEGLSLGENEVLFNGQPWKQVATGDQIDVAVEMAMALNPGVKIIFIRNGSLLDSKHLARIRTKAEERGYQVWLESVDETGAVGIYFEDGEVAAVDGVPVPISGDIADLQARDY